VFTATQIAAMEAQLAAGSGGDTNAARLRFALAELMNSEMMHRRRSPITLPVTACEDASRRSTFQGSSAVPTRDLESRCEFFCRCRARGCADPRRSSSSGCRVGSTLVEQILSSHPAVDATMELPNIPPTWPSFSV